MSCLNVPRLAKKKLGNSLVPHQAYIRDGKLVIRETTDINGWIEEYHRISKVPHHLHHYQSTTWSNPKLHRDKILNRGRKKAVDEL